MFLSTPVKTIQLSRGKHMFGKIMQWLQTNTFNESNKKQQYSRTQPVTWATSQYPPSPLSKPHFDVGLSLFHTDRNVLEPDGMDPRILFPTYRELRDTVPDVSAGIWAWVRLCTTAQHFSIDDGNEVQQIDARHILRSLDRRILTYQHEHEKGVNALVQHFFLSVFTYGAFAGEVVVNHDRNEIESFIVIDPATIRFQMQTGTRELLPCQILDDGTLVRLNPSSFFYYGLDTDGLNPYGRSPLSSLSVMVNIQDQLINDMASAQHNAGYPTIHFKMKKPEREKGENLTGYNNRIKSEIEQIRTEVEAKKTETNLITYDNLEVSYIGPKGNNFQWSESIQAISEQVISALHLAPFMIGRNWGTTESWGSAQYQLLTNNARTVQEGAKRLAEWLRNLELALHGSPCCVTHQFTPHHHLDAADRAKALQFNSDAIINLLEKGLINEDTAKKKIDTFLQHV